MNVLFYDPEDFLDVQRIDEQVNAVALRCLNDAGDGLNLSHRQYSYQGFGRVKGDAPSLLSKVVHLSWVDCLAVVLDANADDFGALVESVSRIRGRPIVAIQRGEADIAVDLLDAFERARYVPRIVKFQPDAYEASVRGLSSELAQACNDFNDKLGERGRSVISYTFGPYASGSQGGAKFSVDPAARLVFYPQKQEFGGEVYEMPAAMPFRGLEFRIAEYLSLYYNKPISLDACREYVIGPEIMRDAWAEAWHEKDFYDALSGLQQKLSYQGDLSLVFQRSMRGTECVMLTEQNIAGLRSAEIIKGRRHAVSAEVYAAGSDDVPEPVVINLE